LTGDAKKIVFPQAQMKDKSHDFSFSGIKTSVSYYIEKNRRKIDAGEISVNDIAAAFQKSVTRAISNKLKRVCSECGAKIVALTGGVAANAYLKKEVDNFAASRGIKVFTPSLRLCTDNAAMVAYAGWVKFLNGHESGMDIEAVPDLKVSEVT